MNSFQNSSSCQCIRIISDERSYLAQGGWRQECLENGLLDIRQIKTDVLKMYKNEK